MLTNLQPAIAANRPLGGFGAGAVLCEGYGVGSLAEFAAPVQGMPRVRRVSWAAAGFGEQSVVGSAASQYQGVLTAAGQHRGTGSAISQQFSPKQHTTRIDPAYRAVLGPHPAREPEPA